MVPVVTGPRTGAVRAAAVGSGVVTGGGCRCAAAATASVAEGCDTRGRAFL